MRIHSRNLLFAALSLSACTVQAQQLSQKLITASTPFMYTSGTITSTLGCATNGSASVGWALILGMDTVPPELTGTGAIAQSSTYQCYWQVPNALSAGPPTTLYLHLDGSAQAVGIIGPTGAAEGGALASAGSPVDGPTSTLALTFSQSTYPLPRRGQVTIYAGSPAATARVPYTITWTLLTAPGTYPEVYRSQTISFTSPTAYVFVDTGAAAGLVTYKSWGSYSVAIQFLTD